MGDILLLLHKANTAKPAPNSKSINAGAELETLRIKAVDGCPTIFSIQMRLGEAFENAETLCKFLNENRKGQNEIALVVIEKYFPAFQDHNPTGCVGVARSFFPSTVTANNAAAVESNVTAPSRRQPIKVLSKREATIDFVQQMHQATQGLPTESKQQVQQSAPPQTEEGDELAFPLLPYALNERRPEPQEMIQDPPSREARFELLS
jgi:hypothetical protein